MPEPDRPTYYKFAFTEIVLYTTQTLISIKTLSTRRGIEEGKFDRKVCSFNQTVYHFSHMSVTRRCQSHLRDPETK